MCGYIYCITNKVNNKKYIGLTTKKPEERWKKHCSEYLYASNYSHRPLYDAMRKYGIENFVCDTVEYTDDIYGREQYWILYYNTYIGFADSSGYNATLGGEGVKKLVITDEEKLLIINGYRNGLSCNQLAKQLHHRVDIISQVLRAANIDVHKNCPHQVAQYSKDGILLNIYESARQACAALNKTGGGSHITEVCNGKRQSSYGYIWKYI